MSSLLHSSAVSISSAANEVEPELENSASAIEERMLRICDDSIAAHQAFRDQSLPALAAVAQLLFGALSNGRKIMLCGNGGSAADTQHVAGEMVGRFLRESDPWPVMALTTDTSILTAVANDWDYSQVFARQVRAFAAPGDVLVGISTSGTSANVIEALRVAREKGARTLGFTGAKPSASAMRPWCDICFCAPAGATPRIQELHLLSWHSICEIVEELLIAAEARIPGRT